VLPLPRRQGSLEVHATDFLGGAAPEVSVAGTLARGKKALSDTPLVFASSGGGVYKANTESLGLTPGVYSYALPCSLRGAAGGNTGLAKPVLSCLGMIELR